MAERLLGYRVFGDAQGKMNLSLADTGGGLLLVSQFTLAADTSIGHAPQLHHGRHARAEAERWFDRLLAVCRRAPSRGLKPAASAPI